MKIKEIKTLLIEYDSFIIYLTALLKANKTCELTEEFLLREINDLKRNQESLNLAIVELKNEKNKMLKRLRELASVLTERDEEILYHILNNKSLKEVAKKTGYNYGYIRTKSMQINRLFDEGTEDAKG